MTMQDEELLWVVNTLAANNHPDPAGLAAQIEAHPDDGNTTGISKEAAQSIGVSSINEPVMSMFAAMNHDIANAQAGMSINPIRHESNPSTARSAIRNRDKVTERVTHAMMQGKQPVNPFLDNNGMLKLHKKIKKHPTEVSDTALLSEIHTLLNEYKS